MDGDRDGGRDGDGDGDGDGDEDGDTEETLIKLGRSIAIKHESGQQTV